MTILGVSVEAQGGCVVINTAATLLPGVMVAVAFASERTTIEKRRMTCYPMKGVGVEATLAEIRKIVDEKAKECVISIRTESPSIKRRLDELEVALHMQVKVVMSPEDLLQYFIKALKELGFECDFHAEVKGTDDAMEIEIELF